MIHEQSQLTLDTATVQGAWTVAHQKFGGPSNNPVISEIPAINRTQVHLPLRGSYNDI
jgi:hypothetical protein